MLNFGAENRLLNRAYLHYLLPGVTAYLFFQLAPVIDALVVSKTLGDRALSAIGLSIPFFYFLNFLATLIGYGAGAKISQAKGAGETVRAHRTFTRAALFLAGISLLCMVLGGCFLPELVVFLGGTPENSAYAQDYVRIVTWGSPPYLISLASFFMLYNDGAPKLAVVGACVGGIFNVILDLILVLHYGLGIKGAAIGMVGGVTVQCLVYLFHMRQKDRLLRFDFSSTKEHLTLPMLWSGLPGGSSYFLKFLRLWLMNLMLLSIGGVTALADGTIIATLVNITVILTIGIGDPVLPTAAVLSGEKNRRGVSAIQRIAVTYDVLLVLPLSVFLFLWPQHFVALFSIDDPQVLATAPLCIRILVLSLFFYCLNGIVINRCVAVGDPRISLQATVLREFLLVVPFAWLFSRIWGESGVWLAFVAAELVTLGWLVIGKKQLRDLFRPGSDNTEWEVSGRLSVSALAVWRRDFATWYDPADTAPVIWDPLQQAAMSGAAFMLSLSVLRDDDGRRLVLRYDGEHDLPLAGEISPLISDTAIGLRRRIAAVRKRDDVRREETPNTKAA